MEESIDPLSPSSPKPPGAGAHAITEADQVRIVEHVTAAVTSAVIKNVTQPLEARLSEIEKLLRIENHMSHLTDELNEFRKSQKERKSK